MVAAFPHLRNRSEEEGVEWLTHGAWRKWVVAYASARSCDGGAGCDVTCSSDSGYFKRMKPGRSGDPSTSSVDREESRFVLSVSLGCPSLYHD